MKQELILVHIADSIMNTLFWLLLWVSTLPDLLASICKENLQVCIGDNSTVALAQSVYQMQDLHHCTPSTSQRDGCADYWDTERNVYSIPLRRHYEALSQDLNHSVVRINQKAKFDPNMQGKRMAVDVTIDARCYHSWTINPYHKIADCLLFIVPALHRYATMTLHKQLHGTRDKIILLVDESTEGLCLAHHTKKSLKDFSTRLNLLDACLLSELQSLLRSTFHFQCISTSNYFASKRWFRRFQNFILLSREYVWLGEQKNPFTMGSGFMGTRHPQFALYQQEYRRVYFNGFCNNCLDFLLEANSLRLKSLIQELGPLRPSAYSGTVGAASNNFYSTNFHSTILVILRSKKAARYIPQHSELMAALGKVRIGLAPSVDLIEYTGKESVCDTIAEFWSAKVIIAAHGAGIVNTIYSRAGTLLIEISPQSLQPSDKPGTPWRLNSPFAHSAGLCTHVLVVPAQAAASSERDLQFKMKLDLEPRHIQAVANITQQYLTRQESFICGRTTVMVS